MTKTASIPITDMADTCTARFGVQYRITGTPAWSSTPDQYDSPIIIPGLLSATQYDYRITRYCCNGAPSAPTTGTFTIT